MHSHSKGMEYIASSRVFTQNNGGHLSNNRGRSIWDGVYATLRRRDHALCFKRSVERANIKNIIEGKTLVLPDSCSTPVLWREDLYGIPRIAVHGIDSICVATRKEDVLRLMSQVYQREDPQHLMDKDRFHREFRDAVIYEVEELAVARLELDKPRSLIMPSKPFGLVSVNLGTNIVRDKANGHEASSAEYDVDKVINLFQEELSSSTTFDFDKTATIAVSALMQLFNQKFKPNEIQVFFLKIEEDDGRNRDLVRTSNGVRKVPPYLPVNPRLNHFEVQEMPTHAERSIKEYITEIYKQPFLGQWVSCKKIG